MKKISVILILALALTVLLVGCNSTQQTESFARWGNEEYIFNITLADFNAETIKVNSENYTREILINGYESYNTDNMDQLKPLNIGGTYSVKIELIDSETKCVYTTEQILYTQYDTSDLENLSIWNDLQGMVVAQDSEENPFTAASDTTTLKSVTKASVTFENTSAQHPLSSTNSCKGFYLGKINQEVTDYTMSTEYDWKNNVVSVTYNGEKTENKVSLNKLKIIDANQVLLYTRSLEKLSTRFQDNPSVKVYTPLTNEMHTASFSFNYKANTLLTGADGSQVPVKLNSVGVLVDGRVLLVELNLPDTINSNGANLDTKSNAGSSPLNKYTVVRFRAGLLSYELATHDAKILQAVSQHESEADAK